MAQLTPRSRTLGGILVFSFVMMLAGCAGSNLTGQDKMTTEEAVRALKTRPDIEQTMKDYDNLLKEIRTEFADVGISDDWRQIDSEGSAGCKGFGDSILNAEVRSTPIWGASGVPDERWPEALAILQRLTAAAGFKTLDAVKNEVGNHSLFIQGPYGAVLEFGSVLKMSMSILSGCHRLPGKPIDPANPGST